MHAQDLQPELKAHLDAEIAAADTLLNSLEAERTALKGTDAAALDRAGQIKLAALKRFEELELERRLLCQVHDDRTAFEQLIDSLDRQTAIPSSGPLSGSGATLRAAWLKLLETTGRCRNMNQANGLIVTIRQTQIRQLLGVLRGAGGAQTYGPSGERSSPATGARAIARA
jgi:flagella synthesis protein FlgN